MNYLAGVQGFAWLAAAASKHLGSRMHVDCLLYTVSVLQFYNVLLRNFLLLLVAKSLTISSINRNRGSTLAFKRKILRSLILPASLAV